MNWSELIAWMIPWFGGYFFNDLMRWAKDRRQWRSCPISTCEFRIKCSDYSVGTQMLSSHVIRTHHHN